MSNRSLNSTAPVFSPLEPIFAPFAGQIPLAFREQFLYSADAPYGMTLEGVMHAIWHKPAWLSPIYWVLGRLGILAPYNAREVPTTLKVVPGVFPSGQLFHRWERTLRFPKPVQFNTTIVYDQRLREVVDLVGRGDHLYMVWTCRFVPPRRFTLDTRACALRFGSHLLWLPRWLWRLTLGTVRFTQDVDEAHDDTVHIDLLITHPILSEIFGYQGTFRTVRTPK
jgi:Domain of unknown function (DUF4166)